MEPAAREEKVAEVVAAVIEELPAAGSRRAYEGDWERYTRWLAAEGVAVLEAKPRHVSGHLTALKKEGKAKSTCGRALSVIREIYGALVRDELMKVNPAREVKNVRMSAEPNAPVLSEDQVRALLATSDDSWKGRRDRLCLLLLFGLGWRRSEVAAIRTNDLGDHTITGVFKGNKRVTVGVPLWLWVEIDKWCQFASIGQDAALLPRSTKNRQAVSDNIVYEIVKTAATRAELPLKLVTPHALRRTNITLGGERGVSLKARQLAVGHTSQATTERYDKARDAAKSAPGQVFADLIYDVRK